MFSIRCLCCSNYEERICKHSGCPQVHSVLPWPVEAGPEFIHGGKTSLTVGLRLACQPEQVQAALAADCALPLDFA